MEKDEEKILGEDSAENIEIETNSNKEETQTVEKNENNKETEKKDTVIQEIHESNGNVEEKKLKNRHKKESKVSTTQVIFIVIAIIFLLFISTIFAILNINNSKIIKGVYIENVDLSNLTKEEAINIINEKINKIEDVELSYGTYNTTVKLEEIGLKISSKDAINNTINLGKTNNIIIDNYSILKANIFKTIFQLNIEVDEEKFEETIKNIQAEIPEAIKEYSYVIKNDELLITNGKAGKKIIKEELKESIILNIKEQFNKGREKTQTAEITTQYEEPKQIDIQKIYSEIYRDAKNAYIIEEPFKLYKEENGIDLAITIEEARKVLEEEKETYVIPLKITKPEIGIEDLGDKLFKQTLAKYTTIYDAGLVNRAHNVALAAKSINGTILLPGETFSYNQTIGNPNKANGYKIGTAYVGGKVVDSYGGGVCQVSTTLYNSVLYANLEIIQRYNHSYIVNYVPAGRDATVSYGGKDFKFKNTRNYPIKIVANAKNGVVSVSIMGIKEETEYEVVLTSTVLSTTPRTVVYEKNSKLEEGKQSVVQSGFDGKTSIAYKILKLNGKTISKTVLSKDTYKPMVRIIEVGTKKVSKPTNTTPETNNDAQTTQNSITVNDTTINNNI